MNWIKVKEKRLRGKRGNAELERQPEGKEEKKSGKGQEAFNEPSAIVNHSAALLCESLLEVR